MPADPETLMQTSCPVEMLDEMRCVTILRTAAELVGGDRNRTHGSKQKAFSNTAALWNAYLRALGITTRDLAPDEVAIMLALLKISRTTSGTKHPDHYLDLCGYGAIAGELAE